MSLERLIPYLARSIKKRRQQLRLTCEQIAEITGFSAEYIAFIESGGTDNFSMKTLKLVAEALRMAPSQLIRLAEDLAEAEKDGHH